jgi:hypothetical protein
MHCRHFFMSSFQKISLSRFAFSYKPKIGLPLLADTYLQAVRNRLTTETEFLFKSISARSEVREDWSGDAAKRCASPDCLGLCREAGSLGGRDEITCGISTTGTCLRGARFGAVAFASVCCRCGGRHFVDQESLSPTFLLQAMSAPVR